MSSIFTYGYGYSKRLCEDITSWFLNTHFPRHHITINVNHRGMVRDNVNGWCDISRYNMNRPRKFLIEIQSNLSREEYIQTLIHELIHVKQWVEGSLTVKHGKMCWHKELASNWDYENQPHEIEAYTKEKELYKLYCASH